MLHRLSTCNQPPTAISRSEPVTPFPMLLVVFAAAGKSSASEHPPRCKNFNSTPCDGQTTDRHRPTDWLFPPLTLSLVKTNFVSKNNILICKVCRSGSPPSLVWVLSSVMSSRAENIFAARAHAFPFYVYVLSITRALGVGHTLLEK